MYPHSLGKRVIAGILFCSHSLMSCSSMLLETDRQESKKSILQPNTHLNIKQESQLSLVTQSE